LFAELLFMYIFFREYVQLVAIKPLWNLSQNIMDFFSNK